MNSSARTQNINRTSEETKWQTAAQYIHVIVVVESITSILLVLGNGFIIAMIQKRKLLGRSTNIFVFSLATADFLNGAISIPTHLLFLTRTTHETVYLCKFYKFLIYITKMVVPYTILFMTAEKTMRILCPTKEIVTVARCMFFTSLWWFFSAAFNIWSVVMYTVYPTNATRIHVDEPYSSVICMLSVNFTYLHDLFLISDLVIIFIAPICMIIVLYLIIVRKCFTVLRERILTYIYVIKLFFALFVTFLVCHLPQEIMTFVDAYNMPNSADSVFLSNITTSFYYTRGIWNLFVYAYFKHYVCHKRHFASIRANSDTVGRNINHKRKDKTEQTRQFNFKNQTTSMKALIRR